MSFYFLAIFFFSCNIIFAANIKSGLKPLQPSEDYTHSTVADEDSPDLFVMYWKILNDQEIQFEIHCKTTGWVSLGISPNGGMEGDYAIGWVSPNGTGIIKDAHSEVKKRPVVDKIQDWTLLDSKEVYISITFKERKNILKKYFIRKTDTLF